MYLSEPVTLLSNPLKAAALALLAHIARAGQGMKPMRYGECLLEPHTEQSKSRSPSSRV